MDNDHWNNDPKNLWVFPTISRHIRYHQQLLDSQEKDGSEAAIRLALENDGLALPLRYDLIGSALDTSRLLPYESRALIRLRLKECGLLKARVYQPRARRQSK
jgi:hypothetical protein